MNAMLDHFKRVWKGEEKLWKVFWLWGVVGNIFMIILPHIISFVMPLQEVYYWLIAFIEIIVLFPLTLFLIFWNAGNTKYWVVGVIIKWCALILFILMIVFFIKTKIISVLF